MLLSSFASHCLMTSPIPMLFFRSTIPIFFFSDGSFWSPSSLALVVSNSSVAFATSATSATLSRRLFASARSRLISFLSFINLSLRYLSANFSSGKSRSPPPSLSTFLNHASISLLLASNPRKLRTHDRSSIMLIDLSLFLSHLRMSSSSGSVCDTSAMANRRSKVSVAPSPSRNSALASHSAACCARSSSSALSSVDSRKTYFSSDTGFTFNSFPSFAL
mmetsp:Transcript_24333/g.48712  ORF Transcript_24333/g.48712 Transcript_24333/m.48712 type:complete len:220 (-) Transcript_24333:549-1208(-)